MNTKCNVLITGTTSGIGYELSKQYALHGYNLILVSRNKEKLEEQKDFLSGYHVKITTITKDLSKTNAAKELYEMLKENHLRVDILVNNAGLGAYGFFACSDFQKEREMIQVHITFLTEFTKLILPQMIKRRHGKILNVASTAAYFPSPLAAVYAATKSYILSFSRALREELKKTGVRVSVLCPGATKTQFAYKANMAHTWLFNHLVSTAVSVASTAFRAFSRNKRVIIPGAPNKLEVCLSQFIPFQLTDWLSYRMWQTDYS